MADGRNRDDQNETGPQPSDPFTDLGQPGLADKVNEQDEAGDGENNSQGREPFTAG